MMITTVTVPHKARRSYEVRIGSGNLALAIPEVRRDWPALRPFVVTDSHLMESGHFGTLVGDAGVDSYVVAPPGESSKTLRTVEAIVSLLEERRYGRDTLIVALGGGTVGDIAGFAAAIFKRGVPCVQVPTTTVAQADSAIGGKVGVDSEFSKNAYGAFHHPVRVYIDCATLKTLDDRHFRAGLAESAKHALIADLEYFEYLESGLDRVLSRDAATLEYLAARNCGIKGNVVSQDPEEINFRRVLNFGHTIGHAVESVSGFRLLHGECVGIGMVGACLIAERLGLSSPDVRRRVVSVLARLGLPASIPAGLAPGALMEAMARDKKASGQRPRFVLIKSVGEVYSPNGQYAAQVGADTVRDALLALLTPQE